jgi:hypothetical protein
MTESDWELGTWEGLRRRQRREFQALPLREKLQIIEQMSEVSALLRARRIARGLPVSEDPRDESMDR